jgi:hypothetical protein
MQDDGLEVIAPATRRVMFEGHDLVIAPLTVGQLPAVARALRGIDLSGGIDVLELIAEHGERVAEAIAVAACVDLEIVQRAEVDEFLTLATAVIEVNADFFARRVAPALSGAFTRVGLGQTHSKP